MKMAAHSWATSTGKSELIKFSLKDTPNVSVFQEKKRAGEKNVK